MIRRTIIISFFILFSTILQAQTLKPEPAEKILTESLIKAKQDNKNVMIVFHASWCKWCKRLENAIESPELKKIFTDNWVVTYVDVLERGKNADSLENQGGKELMKKFGGEKSGLPFCVFLNKKGSRICNSNLMPDKTNIGYPGTGDEIKLFTGMLKKSSKKLTTAQLAAINDSLIKNAPQQ